MEVSNTQSQGGERAEQLARYARAQTDFTIQRTRAETARNALHYYWDDFHDLERDFLAIIAELQRTDAGLAQNLRQLQALRIGLLSSLDGPYRRAVNEL